MPKKQKSFEHALSAHKVRFDPPYKRCISEYRSRYADIEVSRIFFNEIERLHDSGGARLRSFLFCMGFELIREDDKEEVLHASMLMELVHSFLLIHDDIIDQSSERRGGPSVHGSFAKHESTVNLSLLKREHFGSQMAILCGDLLCVMAFELLSSVNFGTENMLYGTKLLSEILIKTILGQGQDILFNLNKKYLSNSSGIAQLKTAHYSFELPLCLGMRFAGSKIIDDELSFVSEFALSCGIAYQMKDDILDYDDGMSKDAGSISATLKRKYRQKGNRDAKDSIIQFKSEIQRARECALKLSHKGYRKEVCDLLKMLPDYIAGHAQGGTVFV